MTLYKILGVAEDATLQKIKSAFRRAALKAHPDQGGTREAMEELQRAYDVLSDPERRARYDATGEENRPPDPEQRRKDTALRLLTEIISMIVEQADDVEHTDIKSSVVEMAQDKICALEKEKRSVVKSLARANAMTKRFRLKSGADEEDLVGSILRAKAVALQKLIDGVEDAVRTFQAVADMVEAYEYEVTAKPKSERPHDPFASINWNDVLGKRF